MNVYVCEVEKANAMWEDGFFSDNVAEHIAKYKRAEDAARSRAAYAVLSRALGDRRNCAVRPFGVGFSITGKPYAVNKQAHFSLSHSGDLVAAAVSENEVGVDVERVRKVSEKLFCRALSLAEREYATDDMQFCKIWTQKESFCKLTGAGMTAYPDRLDTTANFGCTKKVYVSSFELEDYVLSVSSFDDCPVTLVRL